MYIGKIAYMIMKFGVIRYHLVTLQFILLLKNVYNFFKLNLKIIFKLLALNEAIGSITLTNVTVNTSPVSRLSIIGLFYILPEYRNQKIGTWLFNRMLEDCEENKCLFGSN